MRESLDLSRQRITSRLQLGSLLLQLGPLILNASPVGARLRQAGFLRRAGGLGLLQLFFLVATAAHLLLASGFFRTARGHRQGELFA